MELTTLLFIFIGVLVIVAAVLIFFLVSRHNTDDSNEVGNGMMMLQNELQELRKTMDVKLGESSKEINASMRAQLSESQKMMANMTDHLADVKKEVGSFGETNKQVLNFADQLKQLQDVLKNPKQRGVLGEYYLESVLQNVLPPSSYKMQYAFDNGEIVDAVVFVKEKVVPIDSKFSLENYNRMVEASDGAEKARFEKDFINDLKLRIKETAKYIRPSDGTTDFAFMFIPSEGIYYDLLTNTIGAGEESLIQRSAGTHKVIIVSPTSFLAYLQTVLQGLKAMEIEEKAQDIIKNVEKLSNHIGRYEEYYQKLGNTLATTVNHYNAGYKELNKMDKDVLRITGENSGVEVLELDKPKKPE